jgi:arabinogalactan endo-1,4-beta-galactosidase
MVLCIYFNLVGIQTGFEIGIFYWYPLWIPAFQTWYSNSKTGIQIQKLVSKYKNMVES